MRVIWLIVNCQAVGVAIAEKVVGIVLRPLNFVIALIRNGKNDGSIRTAIEPFLGVRDFEEVACVFCSLGQVAVNDGYDFVLMGIAVVASNVIRVSRTACC